MRQLQLVWIFVLSLLGMASPAAATFVRLVDTTTSVPEGTGTFSSIETGVVSGDQAAFSAIGPLGRGLYRVGPGGVERIADPATPVPGGTGNFANFPLFDIDGDTVAFFGDTGSGFFAYAGTPGVLSEVATPNTPPPGGGTIGFASIRSVDAGVFGIKANTADRTVYLTDGVTSKIVSTSGAAVPTSAGETFTEFSPPDVDASGVVFEGRSQLGTTGLYTNEGGSLREIVDDDTPIPGGFGSFALHTDSLIDDGRITFRGGNGIDYEGIFFDDQGALSVLVDSTTLIPGTTETFDAFFAPAGSDGRTVFVGTNDDGMVGGLYLAESGALSAILEFGDTLDGLEVTGIRVREGGLAGDDLVFAVTLIDELNVTTTALYRSVVPEPGTGVLVGTGLGLLAARRRRSV